VDRLLSVFQLTLAAHGLAAESLDPWRAWLAFKEYVRSVNETPDPGVSVQLTRERESREVRLAFVRQVVRTDDDRLAPVGGVVCELTFGWPPKVPGRRTPSEWERWSFEHGSFERFVDIVEREPDFQDLIVARPVRSTVYWEDYGQNAANA
jgi:hypothetical protein